jgi:thiaminase/transcriptional activator TenA
MSTVTDTAFRQELWSTVAPTYGAIVDHPFLAGITDGSLPPESFVYFVEQDRLYLRCYSRALSFTAAYAASPEDTAVFTGSASNAIAVEAGMHRELLEGLGVDPDDSREQLSPSGELYAQTILAHTARGPFADALASVLACFWIYAEMGHDLREKGSPDPRYQRWVNTYGDPEFAATVEKVLTIVDRVGTESSPAERERFQKIFARGCLLEWMFWDCAWRLEDWPTIG